MRDYINPMITVYSFYPENVKTEDVVLASAVETYETWTNRQKAIETLNRKFIMISEITKFKF